MPRIEISGAIALLKPNTNLTESELMFYNVLG
jgi:hypothetical protein